MYNIIIDQTVNVCRQYSTIIAVNTLSWVKVQIFINPEHLALLQNINIFSLNSHLPLEKLKIYVSEMQL